MELWTSGFRDSDLRNDTLLIRCCVKDVRTPFTSRSTLLPSRICRPVSPAATVGSRDPSKNSRCLRNATRSHCLSMRTARGTDTMLWSGRVVFSSLKSQSSQYPGRIERERELESGKTVFHSAQSRSRTSLPAGKNGADQNNI